MKTKFHDIFFIIVICLVIGLGRSLIIQDIDIIKKAPEKVEVLPQRLTEPVFVNLELSEKLFNDYAIFIDARDSTTYSEGHIENAINIPWESSDNDMIKEKLLGVEYDKDIVIYCSGGDCTMSLDLSEYIFNDLSYERVFIFEGGYPIWIENNLPIKRFCEIDESIELKDESCIYVE